MRRLFSASIMSSMYHRSRLELFVRPEQASTKSLVQHCAPCAGAVTAAESNERPNYWSRCRGYHLFVISFFSAAEPASKYQDLVTRFTLMETREQPSYSTYLTITLLPTHDRG